jgi:hypothetical protein
MARIKHKVAGAGEDVRKQNLPTPSVAPQSEAQCHRMTHQCPKLNMSLHRERGTGTLAAVLFTTANPVSMHRRVQREDVPIHSMEYYQYSHQKNKAPTHLQYRQTLKTSY